MPRDHIPVHARLAYSFMDTLGLPSAVADRPQLGFVQNIHRWNRDALMDGLRRGTHRVEFLQR
eukprot:4805689-Pyramimonas_sp.AAC.1